MSGSYEMPSVFYGLLPHFHGMAGKDISRLLSQVCISNTLTLLTKKQNFIEIETEEALSEDDKVSYPGFSSQFFLTEKKNDLPLKYRLNKLLTRYNKKLVVDREYCIDDNALLYHHLDMQYNPLYQQTPQSDIDEEGLAVIVRLYHVCRLLADYGLHRIYIAIPVEHNCSLWAHMFLAISRKD